MKKVKTVFIPATFQKSSFLSGASHYINGDQTTRDIQAAIDEMEIEGYDFMHSENLISGGSKHGTYGISFTHGTILYFKKSESNPS